MSSTVMSSSASELMISSLISFSSVCASWVTADLRKKIVGLVFRQPADSPRIVATMAHQRSDRHILAHFDAKMRSGPWNTPPGHAFDGRRGTTPDQRWRDIHFSSHRHVGCPPLKFCQSAVHRGACALRENDQVVARAQ